MNRIEKKFKQLRKNKKKALIAFITAGYPNLSVTRKLILEFDKIGVDIVELGVPFSDPMADGPIIQESSQFALAKNTHLLDILRLVKDVRKKTGIPICLMTYYNPIFCFGEDKFVKIAALCGVDGVIIPDLPPEEASSLIKLANQKYLDVICFVSPTTSSARARYIAQKAKGFIYYVALTGVTGPRKALAKDLTVHLKALKRLTHKPVCAGFGISNPAQVKEIYKFCDGVIVGSAIVKKIKENLSRKDLVKRVGNFVLRFKDA
ncbi:MAG: tryptophan synthase subunit alpha [Candidatus Omnitrophota bacterium]